MYLPLLNEAQKKIFLSVAVEIASADGTYSDEERTLISAYCQEMEIEFVGTETLPLDELIAKAGLICDERAKRIIVFESIGLALVDLNFDEKERDVIERMAAVFDINDTFVKKCEELIRKYIVCQSEMNRLIIG